MSLKSNIEISTIPNHYVAYDNIYYKICDDIVCNYINPNLPDVKVNVKLIIDGKEKHSLKIFIDDISKDKYDIIIQRLKDRYLYFNKIHTKYEEYKPTFILHFKEENVVRKLFRREKLYKIFK